MGEGAERCVTRGCLGEETCWRTAGVLGCKRVRHGPCGQRGGHQKGRCERVLGALYGVTDKGWVFSVQWETFEEFQ